MKLRYLLFVLIVFAVLLASCGPKAPEIPEACTSDAFGCAEIADGGTIQIGMGAPMTGDYASFGIDISRGGEIAAADAGEFEGFAFELVAEDDQGSSEGGAAVANKFAADPAIAAIAGHIFSGATAAAIPIYDEAGYPMMSPSATNPPLTEMGSPAFNRNAFTDAVQGQFAGEYLYNTLGLKTIAVMHDGGDYGQGLAQIVSDTFEGLGGEVVGFEAITPGEADYSAPLAALAANNPEALYFGGYNSEAAVLTNQMDQSGLGDAIFFGCDGSFGLDYLEKTGSNGEGAYATTLIPADTPDKLAFDAAYANAYGEEAGVLSPYSWNGYDSVAVLIEAIKSVGFVENGTMYIPRGALMKAVRGTSGFDGIAGTVTCQSNGECNASGPVFYVIEGGEWVPAE
jgi:branched-chain amino acid transport system substrate-binding protein